MKTPTFLIKPIPAGLFWGIVGGLSLIAITFATNNGPVQVLPYPIILIAAILVLKFNDTSDKAFKRMLITGLLSSVIMFLILSYYVLLFVNPTYNFDPVSELLRLVMIIAIGFMSSLLLAIIAKPVNSKKMEARGTN